MDSLTSQTREVLNLMQTNKQPVAPIVYYDSAVETSETLDQMLDAATFFIEVNQNDAHQAVFVTGNRTDQRQLMSAIAKFLSTKYADSPSKIRSLRKKIRVSRLDEIEGDVSLFLPRGVQTSWVVRQNQESVTEKLAVNKVLKDMSADGPIYDFDSIENSHKASFLQAATLLLLNFHERSPQEIGLVQISLNAFGQSDVSLLRQLSQQLQRMMDAARTAEIAA